MAKDVKVVFNFTGDFSYESLKSNVIRTLAVSEVDTSYRNNAGATYLSSDATLFAPMRAYCGIEDDCHVYVGETSNSGEYVAEYFSHTGRFVAIATSGTGRAWDFKVGEIDENGIISAYKTTGHKGTIFLIAMLGFLLGDKEAYNYFSGCDFKTLDPNVSQTTAKYRTFAENYIGLTNNLYYRVVKGADNRTIPGQYEKITQKDISSVKILKNCSETEPQVFGKSSGGFISPAVRTITTPKMFPYNPSRVWSTEEEGMIPEMPSYYQWPDYVLTVAQDIQEARSFGRLQNNVLLCGPAGSGKSMGARGIANQLCMPFTLQTFGPDTLDIDLIGRLIPRTEEKNEGLKELMDAESIPSFEDVENDFEASFEKLFGRMPGPLDAESDALQEVLKRTLEAANKAAAGSDFVFIKSPLVQALENGWCVELQEPTIIKRESVLVLLNALMDNDIENAKYQLPTGQVLRRHPDAVVIMTTNADYEGCKALQSSVLSRLNISREVGQPTSAELFNRVKAQLSFPDADDIKLKQMIKVFSDINEFEIGSDITDGISGPRELLDWVQMAMMRSKRKGETSISEETIVEAAFSTVLAKSSQNAEDRESVITGPFIKSYSLKTVEEIQKKYLLGQV